MKISSISPLGSGAYGLLAEAGSQEKKRLALALALLDLSFTSRLWCYLPTHNLGTNFPFDKSTPNGLLILFMRAFPPSPGRALASILRGFWIFFLFGECLREGLRLRERSTCRQKNRFFTLTFGITAK
jgi:hypothetical protein